jgi:crotonobetainyl-CoA:carnitine CoA-transferase CaiB-like acyl-CoA transferase
MGALDGYRVLDLSGEEGHFAGKLLAEMGADVLKVEPPGGDPARRRGPFAGEVPDSERSLVWLAANTSKRGITLNPATPAGRRLLMRLVAGADVLLCSGDAPPANGAPALVRAVITPFGPDGPYSPHAWTDTTAVAAGGFSYLLGDVDRPPVRVLSPQSHYMASMQMAIGVAIALYERCRSGLGQRVDLSVQEATTYALDGPGVLTAYWPMTGTNVGRTGSSLQFGHVRWRVFLQCADGYMANSGILGTVMESLQPILIAEGKAEDLDDPKWLTANSFAALPGHWLCSAEDVDHVHDVVERWQMGHTKAELTALALEKEMLFYPVNDPADILDSVQLRARDYWVPLPVPGYAAPLPFPGALFRGTANPYSIRGRAPRLGEHNASIYGGELGLSRAELAALKAEGTL